MEEAAVVNVATERQKIVWTTKGPFGGWAVDFDSQNPDPVAFLVHDLCILSESIEVGSIGSCESGGEDGVEEEEDQCPRGFPLSLSVPIVLLYLAFVSLLISTFDHPNPYSDIDGRGLSFLEAFYFVLDQEKSELFCFQNIQVHFAVHHRIGRLDAQLQH